jgi:hypothetical protein
MEIGRFLPGWFGSLSSKPILVKTVAMLIDGCQAPYAESHYQYDKSC